MEPMAWVSRFMWWLYDTLGTTMTLIGLSGLLYMAGRGLAWVCDRIIEME